MSRNIIDALAELRSYNDPDEPGAVFDPADFDDDLDSSHPSPVASDFDPANFMDDWGDFADVPRAHGCPDCAARGVECPYDSDDPTEDDYDDYETPEDKEPDDLDPDDQNPGDPDPNGDGDVDTDPSGDEDEDIVRSTNGAVAPMEYRPYWAMTGGYL